MQRISKKVQARRNRILKREEIFKRFKADGFDVCIEYVAYSQEEGYEYDEVTGVRKDEVVYVTQSEDKYLPVKGFQPLDAIKLMLDEKHPPRTHPVTGELHMSWRNVRIFFL